MLFLGIFFFGLWLAGLITSYTMGGFIHALLVLALMALLSCMIRGGSSKRLSELSAAGESSGTGQKS